MGLWANQILALALVALYLWDCLKSIQPQTRIVQQTFSGPKPLFAAFKFGSGLRTLINPLTPFFTVCVASAFDFSSERAVASVETKGPQYSILQALIAVQLGLVAFAAPISLLYMRDQWFLISIALSYLNLSLLSFLAWTVGGGMRLSRKVRVLLLLEAMICIPYSINLLRNMNMANGNSCSLYGTFRRLHGVEQKRYANDMMQFLVELDIPESEILSDALIYVASISDE